MKISECKDEAYRNMLIDIGYNKDDNMPDITDVVAKMYTVIKNNVSGLYHFVKTHTHV